MLRFGVSAFTRARQLAWRRWSRRGTIRAGSDFRLGGGSWALATLLGVAFLALVADPIFAAGKQAVPPALQALGRALTDVAKSDRYLYPLGVFLILSGFVDWTALSRNALMRLSRIVQTAWYFFASIGMAELISAILKQSFGRARPLVAEQYGLFHFDPWTMEYVFASFPSGHSTVAAALFASLALYTGGPKVLFAFAAIAIASCRGIIGVHWPSDVFAGLMLGAWIAYAVAVLFARMRIVFMVDETGHLVRRAGHHVLWSTAERWRRLDPAKGFRPAIRP